MFTSPVTQMTDRDDFEIRMIAFVASTRNLVWYLLAPQREQMSTKPVDAENRGERAQGKKNAERDGRSLAPEGVTLQPRRNIVVLCDAEIPSHGSCPRK